MAMRNKKKGGGGNFSADSAFISAGLPYTHRFLFFSFFWMKCSIKKRGVVVGERKSKQSETKQNIWVKGGLCETPPLLKEGKGQFWLEVVLNRHLSGAPLKRSSTYKDLFFLNYSMPSPPPGDYRSI
eukprot:TRINITY_DN4753_c1_g1_i1.p1 TRINITY_DN4753_c1_g1~~TRINITY_DN4753_c1_g1_i1.p1  ORF type:complete len:127 (-),score=0.29 TRINITY_DN4753_c1_g1_i1:69-449(-)